MRPSRDELGQRIDDKGLIDHDLGAGVEQAGDFARGDLAAADHQASASRDVEKYGNIGHRFASVILL